MDMQDIRYLAEGLNGIVAEATDLFEARIRELVEQGAPWELVREEAHRMFISLVDGYRVQAEASGEEWYRYLRELAVGEAAGLPSVEVPLVERRKLSSAVWWASQWLEEPNVDVERALAVLSERLDQFIKHAGREKVTQLAVADPVAKRFGRVPVGSTCTWCEMLASRGFVYTSPKSAGLFMRFHYKCDCQVVPGFEGKNPVEGYDPGVYKARYDAAVAALRAESKPGTRFVDRHVAVKMGAMFPEVYGRKSATQVWDGETIPLGDGVAARVEAKHTKQDAQALQRWAEGKQSDGTPYYVRLQKAILGEVPWTPELKKLRRELDSAIDRSVALEPFTVSRWAPLDTFGVGKIEEIYSLRGSFIEHRPYIAAADKPSGVKTSSGRVRLHVYVPAGSGLAPVWEHTEKYRGQREVLLLRGGMLDIVNVRQMPDGSPLVFAYYQEVPHE